jgi:hypothetical protein
MPHVLGAAVLLTEVGLARGRLDLECVDRLAELRLAHTHLLSDDEVAK